MKRILFAVSLALMGTVGCGGGGGGGGGTTYTLAAAEPVDVPPYGCQVVAGPVSVGAGSMFYAIDDHAPGIDMMQSMIVFDSIYLAYGCNFDPGTLAISNASFTGSHMESGQIVADSYDFIVICRNPTTDCQFDLTWTATY